MIANSGIETETDKVLGVVSHALNVFGGDTAPVQPPPFAAPRDIEDDLGRGHF